MKHTIELEEMERDGKRFFKATIITDQPEGRAGAQVRSDFFDENTPRFAKIASILHKCTLYLSREKFTPIMTSPMQYSESTLP